MKKEVVIAILIGLGLGLVVTYGIYRAKTSLTGQQAASTSADVSPTPTSDIHNSVVLLAPDDESVQATTDTKITGTTNPNTLVVLFINDVISTTKSDSSGNFSVATSLQQGSNVIVVRAIDANGNTAQAQRTVIVTTASLEDIPGASASAAVATASAKAK